MRRGRDVRRDRLHTALLEFVSQHSDFSLVAVQWEENVSRRRLCKSRKSLPSHYTITALLVICARVARGA